VTTLNTNAAVLSSIVARKYAELASRTAHSPFFARWAGKSLLNSQGPPDGAVRTAIAP
jgi:hypothetical protein